MNLNINHLLPSNDNNAGGLITSVLEISNSIKKYDINSSIVAPYKFPFFKSSFTINKLNIENNYLIYFCSHGLWKSQTYIKSF